VEAWGGEGGGHSPGGDWRLGWAGSFEASLGATARPPMAAGNLPSEALSDVVRIELLHRFGGIWVDSTVYCLRPLDGWLDHAMPSGFFAFNRPMPDVTLSSWFLAAERGCYVIELWRRKALEYWKDRIERDHYFSIHRLFA